MICGVLSPRGGDRADTEDVMAWATPQHCRHSKKGEMGGTRGRGRRLWKGTATRARKETAQKVEVTLLGPQCDPSSVLDLTA